LKDSSVVFTADTLPHAVTLTFDLLTINLCTVVHRMLCSNSVPNLSEIEQSTAEWVMDNRTIPGQFLREQLSGLVLRGAWTELFDFGADTSPLKNP